ncbi:hypothetical protein [Planotetraspora kaengkrachanensis]|uniref:Uncharacterized protein n=1 Tax=Planotetraspora kaengkrachanensis TaxID=575193 RepID=A0A8J3Q1C1_9ACTN|nr:hypothetical protein [Planotetraspora kaengkrachanensis]GIG84932.1 hypothetical protein Pka01_80590 [Planotetraspora kaengkrachanensis]
MSQPGNPVPGPEDRQSLSEMPRDELHIRLAAVVFAVALIVAAVGTAADALAVAIVAAVVALAAIIHMTVWIKRRGADAEDRTREDQPDR